MRSYLLLLFAPIAITVSSGSSTVSAADVDPPTESTPVEHSDQLAPQGGQLLSEGMVRALLKRSTYDLARKLDMDEPQREQFAEKTSELWMPFFQKHRSRLAPLVNRMIEAQWDPDLPSAADAQDWADKALELNEVFAEQFKKSNQELAKLLTPEQLSRFEKLGEQFEAGLKQFSDELDKMKQGKLHETRWAKGRLARRERQQRYQRDREQREFQEVLSSPELAALTVGAWDAYVVGFVREFGLDDAQKLAASSVLDDVRKRAVQYVKSHAEDLNEVKREVKSAEAEQRKQIVQQRAELVKPLNDLFAELRTRLEQIPTEAQRSQAEPPAETQ